MTPHTTATSAAGVPIHHRVAQVEGLTIAYREAGRNGSPKLVLLHGFPSSSHQYRNLIPELATRFHVIAPDYPGFGHSDLPDPATFSYTFDRLSEVVEAFLRERGFDRYGLFVHDYGGPVGFRILMRHPEALEWLIIQNSNAYEVGLTSAWDGFRRLWKNRTPETERPLAAFFEPDTIRDIYRFGAGRPDRISPDGWESDAGFLRRPHATRAQLDLFYDYRTNVELYPAWQAFLRQQQPKTLLFWAQQDPFFTPEGGEAYLTDLPSAEIRRLPVGHFALEESHVEIAEHMHRFYLNAVREAPGEPKERRPMNPDDEAIVNRLKERGLSLPVPSAPAGLYEPYRLDRGTGYLAAQMPSRDGHYVRLGRVGAELTVADGRDAAALAALSALARIREALGGFTRLRGLLRVDGFVASAEGFLEQPQVLDGASEIFLLALGDRGRHARTAFAPMRLPKNNSIELVVTFAYDE